MMYHQANARYLGLVATTNDQSQLQHKSVNKKESRATPPAVYEGLHSPDQPLDAQIRTNMESRFNQDFSRVRVHSDAKAAKSASSIDAQAYTLGKDIVFDSDQYKPETGEGQKLLAHELTHVVQQGDVADTKNLEISKPENSQEQEARQTASQIVSHPRTPIHLPGAQQTTGVLQRQPESDSFPTQNLEPSPVGASAVGSSAIDGFETGKADLTDDHKKGLAAKATIIKRLLIQWPDSFISIVGHTDAVGSDERNTALGQERADAVLAELQADGVPFIIMRSYSLGETALKIKSKQAEPRNRRVEIKFSARRFAFRNLPLPKPTPDFTFNPGKSTKSPSSTPPGKLSQPDWYKPVPPAPHKKSDPIEDALKKDPLLKKIPEFARGPIIDALKRGDETILEKAIGSLNMDGKTKSALTAAAIALLRTLKGERWTPPIPPLHEPPPSNIPEMPKMPGEVIIPGPTIRW